MEVVKFGSCQGLCMDLVLICGAYRLCIMGGVASSQL